MSIAKKVIAIFDIGKTNKKFFLFDELYNEVFREYVQFEEIKDEDGFPSEDLNALVDWMQKVFQRILKSTDFEVIALNFSSYGASLVLMDSDEKIITPLYNYLKLINSEIINEFLTKYGSRNTISKAIGSPIEGMLNSGLQLYWLKTTKSEIFEKIKYVLHLPQYLSFIFTDKFVSDYTSIGCHTALWDFSKKDYHQWVYDEKINEKLAPIKATNTFFKKELLGQKVKTGIGIHDSSSALISYLRGSYDSFVLVSTGTWSVSMNPFADGLLNEKDIAEGCITYMQVDGKSVRSSKFLLGKEYEYQLNKLKRHFGVESVSVMFNKDLFLNIKITNNLSFKWKYLINTNKAYGNITDFDDFETAYHELINEMAKLQVESIRVAMGETQNIQNLFVDGGFSDNAVFMNILAYYLSEYKVYTTNSAYGSALGAALVLSDEKLSPDFLKKHYYLRQITPFSLK